MNFIALDVETTGTLSYVDHIVELAAVRFTEGQEVDHFSCLVNPGISMPKEAERVNGISDEMLKDKPPISHVIKGFSDFCGEEILVAHNAIFDFQFLSTALEKCHCLSPRGPLFDTYSLSKKVFPGLNNYKLSTLTEYLNIPVSQFHRARQDAFACGKLFDFIIKKTSAVDMGYLNFKKLSQISGKKELRFPPLQSRQLPLF